jgi:pyroglutamyl-peptidase
MVEAFKEKMSRLLLTGFEPFDGDTINPSLEVIHALAARVSVAELPVDREKAVEIALAAIEVHNPGVLIMLGLSTGRSHICVERIAINVDDFRIPDNAGNQPRGEAIFEGGPAAYFSTLPIYAIRDRLAEAHIPAVISNTAGTYLCNRVFYSVMRHLAVSNAPMIAGFIHLP